LMQVPEEWGELSSGQIAPELSGEQHPLPPTPCEWPLPDLNSADGRLATGWRGKGGGALRASAPPSKRRDAPACRREPPDLTSRWRRKLVRLEMDDCVPEDENSARGPMHGPLAAGEPPPYWGRLAKNYMRNSYIAMALHEHTSPPATDGKHDHRACGQDVLHLTQQLKVGRLGQEPHCGFTAAA